MNRGHSKARGEPVFKPVWPHPRLASPGAVPQVGPTCGMVNTQSSQILPAAEAAACGCKALPPQGYAITGESPARCRPCLVQLACGFSRRVNPERHAYSLVPRASP